MNKRIVKPFKMAVFWLEKVLALVVLAGVLFASVRGAAALAGMDWTSKDTFYELIYRALLVVIGLELVRMLITHSLAAVLELLAFVIARKMLKPDLTAVDVFLGVAAFIVLLGGRKYLMSPTCYDPRETNSEEASGLPE